MNIHRNREMRPEILPERKKITRESELIPKISTLFERLLIPWKRVLAETKGARCWRKKRISGTAD